MTEEQFEIYINKRLENLFDLYPIENLQPLAVSEEMKGGLAKAYAERGYRMYLENSVKIALRNMATAPKDQIMYYKSRVDVLEQLLSKGKQMYESTEKRKK